MKNLVRRSRFSGYKGFDRIGREAGANIKSFEENLKSSIMGNPFIGDTFFKENPTKILGEQYEDRGQFGNVIIKVRGSIDNLQKIDAQPVKQVDLYPTENLTVETKVEIINAVFDNEAEKIKKERKSELRTGRKKADIVSAGHLNQEVYNFHEISDMYNKDISRDEMEAYYFTHPELNYKLLIDEFKNSKQDLIEKGLVCYDNNKFVYLYTYQSGNISKKISYLNRDKDKIVAQFGEKQWGRQMQFLLDVMPKSKGFIGSDKITLLPHSNFARENKITELKYNKPELRSETSLFNAFKWWLRYLPADEFKKSNSHEVIEFYLENKSIPVDKNSGKDQQVKDEKNAINIRQRTKEDGDLLFAKFLAEELKPEDQSRIAYLWNEKFNAIAEPNLSKIPVCFQISKTFKAGVPFSLNPTQRQAAAFGMEKFSDLLAYGVGVGKAHLLTSNILTPKGFVKMGDIKIGDEVIGKNGRPTKVTGVFPQGKRQCYEFVFSDGSKTSVSDEHLWKVQKIKNRDNKNGLWHVLTAKQIVDHGLYTKRGDYYYSIPMVDTIEFAEQELIIDPYIMGRLIGDGSLGHKRGGIGFSNPETDIQVKVSELLPESVSLKHGDKVNKDFRIARKASSGKNEVMSEINDMNLRTTSEHKFIPHKYLFNTAANRLKLLQGLLDTDGYINTGCPSRKKSAKKGCSVHYTTISKQLCEDIKFLVQTFGGTATVTSKIPTFTYKGEKKTGQLAYTLTIRLPKGIMPVSSNKQSGKFIEKTKYQPVRFIEAIHEIGLQECQCISVAAEDHLYVCEECIVTHNTASAIVCASQAFYNNLAKKFLFAVPTNTYDKWIGEIQGYTDSESGQFMQGLLPQLPPVIGIYNLNPTIVKDKLKIYSKNDEVIFSKIEDAMSALRNITKGDPTQKQMDAIAKIYPVNWLGMQAQYNAYLSKSTGSKSFVEYAIQYLKEEYNYHIYSLGTIKQFPDGTIFVTTEVGIQRLGVSDENKDELFARMYKILSQGEATDPKKRAKEIAALELRINQTISSGLKNAKLYLEDLGIDWVCFDEAHLYKKLFTFVKGSIAEVREDREGNTTYKREKSKYELKSGALPSARALSAFVISHYVQSKNENRNVIQLTATPFTNSPLEVFSMLTLTNYKTLEDMGMDNMVDFFDTFMKINYDIKYTPQKTVVKDVVLTGYNNLPQLRQIIYSLMDKKDAGAGLKRPTKIVFPSLQNGIETTLPMTVEQNELVRNVKAYIMGDESYEAICSAAQQDEIEATDFDGLEDEPLILEWERLTGKEFEGEREGLTDSRRDALIKAIKSAKQDGIELGVDDLDEDESLGVKILKGLSMLRQITLSPFLYYKACRKAANQQLVLPDYKEYIETSPKLKYVMGCIKSVIDFHVSRNEKISGQVIYMNAGVEYFPLIKEYCVKVLHLKESQVGIVSGGMSKGAKETVKQGFLKGDILILIGSSTISVGVDLQNNSTCLYNCYYDWNPTDAAQIEGRIWRQGNRFAFVRIVYPQCFNSADPVIFEYLSSKTLRINEIWNRSSDVNELDLRDFDPKALQKKLITDPEEKADWEILEETDALEGNILFYENRKDQLQQSITAFQNYKKYKPKAIQYLHELSDKKLEITRSEAIANQKNKISEIVDKYPNDTVKMAAEIEAYKKGRYDYVNDPDGKFKSFNYMEASDSTLINDAKKWEQIMQDWTWQDRELYPDFYNHSYEIKDILRNFRVNAADMAKAQERILKPMGLDFENLENPMQSFNEKLDKLREERQTIEDSKPARVDRIKAEFAAQGGFSKTVADRVEEFASYNEKYLTEFLSVVAEPIEIPTGNNAVTPAAPAIDIIPEHESTETTVHVTPEAEIPAVAEVIEVIEPAKETKPGKEKNRVSPEEITAAISKFGWNASPEGEDIALYNRKENKVVIVKQKGNKYQFYDTIGNKLMSGTAQLTKGAEKLLQEYYYAKADENYDKPKETTSTVIEFAPTEDMVVPEPRTRVERIEDTELGQYRIVNETQPYKKNKNAEWVRVTFIDKEGTWYIAGEALDKFNGDSAEAIKAAKIVIANNIEKDKAAKKLLEPVMEPPVVNTTEPMTVVPGTEPVKPALSKEAIEKLIRGLEVAAKFAQAKDKTKLNQQIADLRGQLLKEAA